MVCFAWALKDRPPCSETRRFAGDRGEVRRQSVIRALQGLIEVLDEAQSQD
jgi:nicotinamide-nucleotide amidase